MKNKTLFILAVISPLFLFSGCWQTGDTEYVGIVTKLGKVGAVFDTWEGELHLVDQKGTMVADRVEFGVDMSSEHGENLTEIVAALRAAQTAGTRVKITCKVEMVVGCWRSQDHRLVVKIEPLP